MSRIVWAIHRAVYLYPCDRALGIFCVSSACERVKVGVESSVISDLAYRDHLQRIPAAAVCPRDIRCVIQAREKNPAARFGRSGRACRDEVGGSRCSESTLLVVPMRVLATTSFSSPGTTTRRFTARPSSTFSHRSSRPPCPSRMDGLTLHGQ